jgi:hypothetical protein
MDRTSHLFTAVDSVACLHNSRQLRGRSPAINKTGIAWFPLKQYRQAGRPRSTFQTIYRQQLPDNPLYAR